MISAANSIESSAAGKPLAYTAIMEDANGNKKYRCSFPGCGKEFLLKGNLKRHQNIHVGVKKFKCEFCDKPFLRKADMEVHLRVHTGEKPYKCDHEGCSKAFARRSDLLSHKRIHDGKKPFTCEFPGCNRSFARRFDLRKHEKTHETTGSKKKRRNRSNEPPVNKLSTSSLLGNAPVRSTLGTMEFCAPHNHHECAAAPHAPAEPCGPLPLSLDAFFASESNPSSVQSVHVKPSPMKDERCADSMTTKPAEMYSLMMSDIPMGGSVGSVPLPPAIPPQVTMGMPQAGEIPGSGALLFPPMPQAQAAPVVGAPVGGAVGVGVGAGAGIPTGAPASAVNAPVMDPAQILSCSHGPACGHLSILHGNHHDYIVNNHLVCKNGSVKSLRCGKASQTDCRPEDTHRPGCGHLAVRHKDHIDYVVEDNLLCQHHGLDEEPGQLELLDDDFWEFYNAIGFFNN